MKTFIHNNVITWKTGRQYSAEGHRLAAIRLTATGCVAFLDADRGIEGVTTADVSVELRDEPLKHFVMTEYDAGRYVSGFGQIPELMGASAAQFEKLMKMAAVSQAVDGRILFKTGGVVFVDKEMSESELLSLPAIRHP